MRVLLTMHVQRIVGAAHRPHDLKLLSIPLEWYYERVGNTQRGIAFANEQGRVTRSQAATEASRLPLPPSPPVPSAQPSRLSRQTLFQEEPS